MKKYFSPTPKKWRKVGDSLLLLSVGVSGSITGLPMPDNEKMWLMFAVSLLGTFGKIMTNFAGDEPQPQN